MKKLSAIAAATVLAAGGITVAMTTSATADAPSSVARHGADDGPGHDAGHVRHGRHHHHKKAHHAHHDHHAHHAHHAESGDDHGSGGHGADD